MKFERVTLEECPPAAEAVVVIDVCRAFTTAAFALAAGARRIILVQTVAEAIALRRDHPGWLLMGEVNGLPVEGFDLWNSPSQVEGCNLGGKTLVLRTSSGTQGVVRCREARLLLAGSFVVGGATVDLLRQAAPESVAFVLTGVKPDQSGVEDIACADYLQALFQDRATSAAPYLRDAEKWDPQRISADPAVLAHLRQDLSRCLQADRFDFHLRVQVQEGYPVLVGM